MKKLLALLLLSACQSPGPTLPPNPPPEPTPPAMVEMLRFGPLPIAGTHQNPKMLVGGDGKLQLAYVDRSAKKLMIIALEGATGTQSAGFPVSLVPQGLTKYQIVQPVGAQALLFSKPELALYDLSGKKEILAKGYFEVYAGTQVADKQIVVALGTIDGVTDAAPGKPWVFYRKVGESSFHRVKYAIGTTFKLHMKPWGDDRVVVTQASGGDAVMSAFDVPWLFSKGEIKLVAIKSVRDSQRWHISADQGLHFADPISVVTEGGPKLFSTVWDDKVVDMSGYVASGSVEDLPQNGFSLVMTAGQKNQVNHALPALFFAGKTLFVQAPEGGGVQLYTLGAQEASPVGGRMAGVGPDMAVRDGVLYVSTTQGLWKLK